MEGQYNRLRRKRRSRTQVASNKTNGRRSVLPCQNSYCCFALHSNKELQQHPELTMTPINVHLHTMFVKMVLNSGASEPGKGEGD